MTLTERIERRKTPVTPIIERRGGESEKLPEWRRRALEQQARLGYVAVTDLTERGAA